MGAMQHPGGGKNDIPNRMKRHFFSINMVLPSATSVENIFGSMLKLCFPAKKFKEDLLANVNKLTSSTIALWDKVKKSLMPTPSKFHYLFNMRELSRVFQGMLQTPPDVINTASAIGSFKPPVFLVGLWKHECERVFSDKLTENKDKEWLSKTLNVITADLFTQDVQDRLSEPIFFCDFLRPDELDEEGEVIEASAPKVYESIPGFDVLREKINEFMVA